MKKNWWKVLCVILLLYSVVGGFLMDVPRLHILNESIRNTFFHVPMWLGMMILLLVSMVYSVLYLKRPSLKYDCYAAEFAKTGILFGVLGIVTGMIWAKFTWTSAWSGDPKQNNAAIALLIYFAYLVLRGSMKDPQQRSRISAVYNILAFSTLIPLLYILPAQTDSLHPGSGGNAAFGDIDLDNRLRAVFYPAVIGWTLLGVWFATLGSRISIHRNRLDHLDQ
ncbi:MAG: heme exporter protein C [Cyclobacteriaceae bacterium]|nr:MAG: heme exporter protein C [Cyclobacteriaceae bacterium]